MLCHDGGEGHLVYDDRLLSRATDTTAVHIGRGTTRQAPLNKAPHPNPRRVRSMVIWPRYWWVSGLKRLLPDIPRDRPIGDLAEAGFFEEASAP